MPPSQVLCTGDEAEAPGADRSSHYFYTSMVLPMSTFALAIGRWKCVQVISPEKVGGEPGLAREWD